MSGIGGNLDSQGGPGPVGAAGSDASTAHRVRSVLAIRAFRRLWGVTFLLSMADWLSLFALSSLADKLIAGYFAQSFAFSAVVLTQLLPGLLLRSLIPLGFMPMFEPGYGVRFVLCEGYAPVPGTAASKSMDMRMDPAMHAMAGTPDHLRQNDAPPVEGSTPDHQDHGNCPYGTSPALGGFPTQPIVSVTIEPASALVLTAPQVTYFRISPRAQSSRGPPA